MQTKWGLCVSVCVPCVMHWSVSVFVCVCVGVLFSFVYAFCVCLLYTLCVCSPKGGGWSVGRGAAGGRAGLYFWIHSLHTLLETC